MADADQYEVVIGLEVHAQLLTNTKLFCGDATSFGQEPNTQVSAISLGHPGTLPKMNKEAIHMAIRLGLACNCEIVQHNYFARKNYFYADLPKGYQISQHSTPICRNGFIDIEAGSTARRIRINRIHMEEDAGKSIHDDANPVSLLDFNRAGTPLLEIVTEPDLRSADEAFAYVSKLRKLVRHLGVCDGNMEEGSLRCDVNISVRPAGDPTLGTKVEIKNLNSIRFIKKAIEHERSRLIALHRRGETILQQTRGFDETNSSTYPIRTKENEDDYRYFPDPDLPPFTISTETIETIRAAMPALPEAVKRQLMEDFGLSEYDAQQISSDQELSRFFIELIGLTGNAKAAANWTIGPVKNFLPMSGAISDVASIPPASIARLIALIDEGVISYGLASQKIFPELVKDPHLHIDSYITEKELSVSAGNEELDRLVEAALIKHSQKITDYKKGKKGLISLFVGEVMKLSGGKADARLVTEKITEKLNA
ncbi:MAG TPA: Asp-tRNA(Asn)/Glu-tRNA(Gln) amidotransferase subunit GatB [Flavisolibacter sp.]|nr:Asp-tRNA(Asn)/Glu-tRNA(Gln) amidotransferase subunit GatB [Flavisolibacter sp.]